MFSKLTQFGIERTGKQAFGFYLAYFVIILLLSFLGGGLAGLIYGEVTDELINFATVIGNVVAVIFTLVLGFLVLRAKHQLNNFAYLLLIIVAGILALFGGALLGLVPVAYLTTKGVMNRLDTEDANGAVETDFEN